MHGQCCQHLIQQRNRKVSSFPPSFESIPYVPLLDNNSTQFSGRPGMPLEAIQQTKGKKVHQLLHLLSLHSSAPAQLLDPLQMELTNIDEIYNSYKPTIISAINLLNTDTSLDGQPDQNTCLKRSLLPFPGDALRWLTGTATTKDVNGIKELVNQLIQAQSIQPDTLIHIIPILNVT